MQFMCSGEGKSYSAGFGVVVAGGGVVCSSLSNQPLLQGNLFFASEIHLHSEKLL